MTDSSSVEESSSGVAVLDRAFAILDAFGPTDDRLTLAEISRRTALYKSTVLRLLGALEHGGFIRKLDDGQYAIGAAPLRFAALYQRSFKVGPVIEPILQQLSHDVGETASFYVRQGDHRLVLYRFEPARTVRGSEEGAAKSFPSTKARPARCCSPSRRHRMRAGTAPANDSGRCRAASAIRKRHRCPCRYSMRPTRWSAR